MCLYCLQLSTHRNKKHIIEGDEEQNKTSTQDRERKKRT